MTKPKNPILPFKPLVKSESSRIETRRIETPRWRYNYIEFDAIRSRGPGGQNVNKVSSAAVLCWDFRSDLGDRIDQIERIEFKLSSLLNKDGHIQIRSDEFRDLPRNKDRCIEKLNHFIKEAFFVPKPRKATKPTFSSVKKRKDTKLKQSENKKLRAKIRL